MITEKTKNYKKRIIDEKVEEQLMLSARFFSVDQNGLARPRPRNITQTLLFTWMITIGRKSMR